MWTVYDKLGYRMWLTAVVQVALAVLLVAVMASSAGRCAAVATPGLVAHEVDILLPGPAVRFDYESLDTESGLLYISHMDAGHVVVFDTRKDRVVADIAGCPGCTGVLYVPQLGRVYSSASRAHEVIAIDAATRKVVAVIHGIRFPDGIAYAPVERKLFVSDESGGRDVVIDGTTNREVAAIDLGGQAGNTQYDPVSQRIFVNVQTCNQVVAIDPKTDVIVNRYDLPGAEMPHGMYIDSERRIAFIACEANAVLLVLDMRTMKVIETHRVGDGPDVLAFDPGWRRLYVAAESGIVSVFDEHGRTLTRVGEIRAPHAHSVAVDPATHRVYLPLEDVQGRAILCIVTPVRPKGVGSGLSPTGSANSGSDL